jgi:hypothetical protein
VKKKDAPSRQALWQRAKRAAGKCHKCGNPNPCLKHRSQNKAADERHQQRQRAALHKAETSLTMVRDELARSEQDQLTNWTLSHVDTALHHLRKIFPERHALSASPVDPQEKPCRE